MVSITSSPSPRLCACGCGNDAPMVKLTNHRLGVIKGQYSRFIQGHNVREDLATRFWAHVTRGERCWEWQLHRTPNGYGQVKAHGRTTTAHRVAWELTYGPIPDGLFVCHHCDNRTCCRPDHLFLGTCQDNHDDAKRKGRTLTGDRHPFRLHPELVPRGDAHHSHQHPEKNPRGSHHGNTTLTEEVVLEIRRLFATGSVKRRVILAAYPTGTSTYYRIIKRLSWTHI